MFLQGHQITDAPLHLHQQRRIVRIALLEQVHAGHREASLCLLHIIEFIELTNEVTTLPAPSSQKRMRMSMHLIERQLRQIDIPTECMTPARNPSQQLTAVHDVRPVKATWIGDRHQHLAVFTQCGQQLQRGQWHAGHAEHHHTPRHRPGQRRPILQRMQDPLVYPRADAPQLDGPQAAQQGTPQHRLPTLFRRNQLRWTPRAGQLITPLRPSFQPVSPVHLILIEQVRQAAGQLVQSVGLIPLQETSHRLETWLIHPLGQELHQTPSQWRLVGGALAGHLLPPQYLPIGPPHESGR